MFKYYLVAVLGLVAACGVALYANHQQPAITSGSVSGPDLYSPYFNVNGVFHYYARTKMNLASTTLCSFKSPPATTTLAAANADFITGTTTASNVVIAKATTPYASTTLLAQLNLAANALATINATSSATNLTDNVMPPSTYITVTQSGGAGTFSPSGSCEVIFRGV